LTITQSEEHPGPHHHCNQSLSHLPLSHSAPWLIPPGTHERLYLFDSFVACYFITRRFISCLRISSKTSHKHEVSSGPNPRHTSHAAAMADQRPTPHADGTQMSGGSTATSTSPDGQVWIGGHCIPTPPKPIHPDWVKKVIASAQEHQPHSQ
jgi:hypothetical protein